MNIDLIIILALSAIFFCCILILQHLAWIRQQNQAIQVLSFDIREKMTSAQWHSQMVMSQEYGKLKVSQMELLNQVEGACMGAMKDFDVMLQNMPGSQEHWSKEGIKKRRKDS